MTVLALTLGEPAGIGPDLCLLLASTMHFPVPLVAIADPELLVQRAHMLGLAITLREYSTCAPVTATAQGELLVLPVKLRSPCTAGTLSVNNAHYVMATLERAAAGCMSGEFQGLVTGPVQKSSIIDAGFSFSGHTEFLAEHAGVQRVVMMLATTGLRVALATTHLPLAAVPGAINKALLAEVLGILHHDLQQKFGIARPRILVAGLNPHAGEGGHLGREEIDIIAPVLEQLRAQGMDLLGPLPADTLFTAKYLDKADAVLAMYHDQGLPVLKYKGFGQAVNITLGLPYVRTSVDHGTALDLAGTGNIDTGSLAAAIATAVQLVQASGPSPLSGPSA